LSNLQSHLKTHGDNRSIAALSAAHENINNNNNNHVNNNNNNGTSIHSFKCNKCNNSYSNKEELLIHIASKHTEQSSNMMNDNKSKTSQNKRHFCELCHKRFATEGVISKHIQQSHPQNEAVLVRNLDGTLMIKAINSNINK
jgi:hypothetical protein